MERQELEVVAKPAGRRVGLARRRGPFIDELLVPLGQGQALGLFQLLQGFCRERHVLPQRFITVIAEVLGRLRG